MYTFIVLDKDDKEISRKESDYEPGYERHDDGKFYRTKGDPRYTEPPINFQNKCKNKKKQPTIQQVWESIRTQLWWVAIK